MYCHPSRRMHVQRYRRQPLKHEVLRVLRVNCAYPLACMNRTSYIRRWQLRTFAERLRTFGGQLRTFEDSLRTFRGGLSPNLIFYPLPGKNNLHISVLAGFLGLGWGKSGKNGLDSRAFSGLWARCKSAVFWQSKREMGVSSTGTEKEGFTGFSQW